MLRRPLTVVVMVVGERGGYNGAAAPCNGVRFVLDSRGMADGETGVVDGCCQDQGQARQVWWERDGALTFRSRAMRRSEHYNHNQCTTCLHVSGMCKSVGQGLQRF
jgi:hypothetical protein